MSSALIAALEAAAPAILSELESLVLPILGSSNPIKAIQKAKLNLEMDTLDEAADLAANEALKAIHKVS